MTFRDRKQTARLLVASFLLVLAGTQRALGADSTPAELRFVDAAAQSREFIEYYHSITLTPEQARTKAAALGGIKAPCCERFSLATCCCPCNLAKAAWGLSHYLIAREDRSAEQVTAAVADWLRFVNRDGFTGDACFSGGCGRPFHANGCGGMHETSVSP